MWHQQQKGWGSQISNSIEAKHLYLNAKGCRDDIFNIRETSAVHMQQDRGWQHVTYYSCMSSFPIYFTWVVSLTFGTVQNVLEQLLFMAYNCIGVLNVLCVKVIMLVPFPHSVYWLWWCNKVLDVMEMCIDNYLYILNNLWTIRKIYMIILTCYVHLHVHRKTAVNGFKQN